MALTHPAVQIHSIKSIEAKLTVGTGIACLQVML